MVAGSGQSPVVECLRAELVRRSSEVLGRMFDQAINDAELHYRPDPDSVQAHLIGTLIYRVTIEKPCSVACRSASREDCSPSRLRFFWELAPAQKITTSHLGHCHWRS